MFVIEAIGADYLDGLVIESELIHLTFDNERERTIVLGKPVHIERGFDERLIKSELVDNDLWQEATENYFGSFYIVKVRQHEIEILSPSSTHGIFFCQDRNHNWVISTQIEKLVPLVPFDIDIEQCFLYTTQNISHDPFHTLLKTIHRAPGLTLLTLGGEGAFVRAIELSKNEHSDDTKRGFIRIAEALGSRLDEIYTNPIFSVSGGIDGIALVATQDSNSSEILMFHGYENSYTDSINQVFSDRLKQQGIENHYEALRDSSYNVNFDRFYSYPIKSNWIASGYKQRPIENRFVDEAVKTTVINGYGIDESYEWFRPFGLAYSTVNASSPFYVVDYLLSKLGKLFSLATKQDIIDYFESSKVFAAGDLHRYRLDDFYTESVKRRIHRCFSVVNKGYDYRKQNADVSIKDIRQLSNIQIFMCRHYLANSSHLLRFHYIFSNALVRCAQPWESMPFIKIFAQLRKNDLLKLYPKSLLFEYLKVKNMDYISILRDAQKDVGHKFHLRQSIVRGYVVKFVSRLLRMSSLKKTSPNKFSIESEDELNRLRRYLNISTIRPQAYLDGNTSMQAYFDSLDQAIVTGTSMSDITAHEIRNYVHLCYMLHVWSVSNEPK